MKPQPIPSSLRAKRSNSVPPQPLDGLPRRCAPRNDESTEKKFLYEQTERTRKVRRKSDIWNRRRRAIQSMRCRYSKPWAHATGPRTDAGKSIVSQNAYVHGGRSAGYTHICALLARQGALMRALNNNCRVSPVPAGRCNTPSSPGRAGRNAHSPGRAPASGRRPIPSASPASLRLSSQFYAVSYMPSFQNGPQKEQQNTPTGSGKNCIHPLFKGGFSSKVSGLNNVKETKCCDYLH